MSLTTWIRAFYPLEAQHTPEHLAITASLRKWKGLLPAARKKHRVHVREGDLADNKDTFHINSDSCALCVHYYDLASPDTCTNCPLTIVRGGKSCCNARPDETLAPWHRWIEDRTPTPMIRWLRKAAAMEQQAKKKEKQKKP